MGLAVQPPWATEPFPLLVELPERAKQRRWTVLIRLVLALPLAIVTGFVGLGTFFCAIAGWFAALFTGRAPQFLRSILTGYLRLSLRLYAYGFLLSDRFPPFDFEEAPDDTVAMAVPPPTTLNRAAVFFRLILAVPAYIVVTLVAAGSFLIAIFGWFASLITGWLPQPVHDALRASVRYQTRFNAYFYLLLPTYPVDLFGDTPAPAPVWMPPPVPGAAQPVPDAGQEAVGSSIEAPPLEPAAPTPAPAPAPAPRAWRLVLSASAKRLLVLAILLGVAAYIVPVVLGAVFGAQTQDRQALVQANNQLVGDFNEFSSTARTCTTVSCLEQASSALSGQLSSFVSAVQGAGDAGVNPDAVNQVTRDAQSAAQATAAVANAGSTLSAYQQAAARVQLVQRLNALGLAQQRFATAINNS